MYLTLSVRIIAPLPLEQGVMGGGGGLLRVTHLWAIFYYTESANAVLLNFPSSDANYFKLGHTQDIHEGNAV